MHELTVINSILKIVLKLSADNNAHKVVVVHLQVGELRKIYALVFSALRMRTWLNAVLMSLPCFLRSHSLLTIGKSV
jgi:Zn finger protein HypA/HybF involved in hydrogenase expression